MNIRHYSKTIREELDRDKCFYCNRKLTIGNKTFDHIHPLSRNGLNESSNLVRCCSKCNTTKGNLLLHELIVKLNKDLEFCTDDIRRKRILKNIRNFTIAKEKLKIIND